MKRFSGFKAAMVALLLAAAMVFAPMSAEAHLFMLVPGESNIEVGGDVEVTVSYTEVTTEVEYSLYYMDLMFAMMDMYYGTSYGTSYCTDTMEIDGSLIYNDGTNDKLSFSDYDDPEKTYMEQFESYFTALGMEFNGTDGYQATSTIAKEGTVIKEAGLVCDMGSYDYIAHSKQIINLTNDGLSMAAVGSDIDDGNGIAEIIPLTDLALAQEGDEIEFQLLLCGEPREGEMIQYSTESTELYEGNEGSSNQYDLVETDEDGKFTYAPTAGEVNTLAIMFRSDPDDSTSKYYCASISFELTEPVEEEEHTGSGGGCNAGFGGLALAALALVAMMKKRG